MYSIFYNLGFYFPNQESKYGKLRESDEQFETNMHAYKKPLITAIIEKRSLSLIKSLMTIDHIEEVDERHNNCLHVAAVVAPYKSEIIKELLNFNVNINLQNEFGDTPLHLSAHNPLCDFNLVKILIDNGANVNIRNNSDETPLFQFIRNCNEKEKCEDHLKIIKSLLRNGAELNIQNKMKDCPLFLATELPSFISVKLVEEFLNYKIDVFVRYFMGNTVLHKLSSKNQAKIAEILCKKHPLLLATKNFDGETPLHTAAFYRASFEVIEALITNGAGVNECDNYGNRPLHLIRSKPFPIIKSLIRHGADINCLNKSGHTPLMQSLVNFRFMEETCHALIYFGADLNIQDLDGRSALHYALELNFIPPKIVQLLLENGANPLNTKFGCSSPIFYCPSNTQISEMYIQYVLLYILKNRDEYRDSHMELMRFDSYDEEMDESLSSFRDRCVEELYLMKRDILHKGFIQEVSLLDYVYSQCSNQSFADTDSNSFVKEILSRLHSQRYKHCYYLLLCCLKEKVLYEYVAKIKICSKNISDQEADLISSAQNSVKTIRLDYDSIIHISKFLDKNSLTKLAIAAYLSETEIFS